MHVGDARKVAGMRITLVEYEVSRDHDLLLHTFASEFLTVTLSYERIGAKQVEMSKPVAWCRGVSYGAHLLVRLGFILFDRPGPPMRVPWVFEIPRSQSTVVVTCGFVAKAQARWELQLG